MEPLHAHAETTTVHVLDGVVYLISEDDERAMTPGDEATIAAGELHRLFNAGDDEAHLCEGVRPVHCPGVDDQ
jgi:quercetin dioxygenase-like cupin family protein